MSPFARRVVIAAALFALPLACAKSSTPSPRDGAPVGGTGGTGQPSGGSGGTGGTGGAPPAGGSGGASVDAFVPLPVVRLDASAAGVAPKDCRSLLNCIHACDKDKTCAGKCVSSAPAAAQSLYKMIQMCSLRACPDQDLSCRCENECQGGGQCADMVDECDQGNPDDFCDPVGPECGI
jgi:hypothetical protein